METRKTLLLGMKRNKDTVELTVGNEVIEISLVTTQSGNKCMKIKANECVNIKRHKNGLDTLSQEE